MAGQTKILTGGKERGQNKVLGRLESQQSGLVRDGYSTAPVDSSCRHSTMRHASLESGEAAVLLTEKTQLYHTLRYADGAREGASMAHNTNTFKSFRLDLDVQAILLCGARRFLL
jgi:hypothetical protein